MHGHLELQLNCIRNCLGVAKGHPRGVGLLSVLTDSQNKVGTPFRWKLL